MFDDIRFSLRTLWRRPGLSLAAVLTLGLGIGASVAVFSVLSGVVLQPLAYPDSDSLVNVYRTDPPVSRGPVTKQNLAGMRQNFAGVLTVAGHDRLSYTVGTAEGARRLLGSRVTQDFFPVFGLNPLRGRWLDDGDQSGDTNGVVISSGFWTQHFARRDDAIGADLVLNGEPWTVVGIAPPAMDFPSGTDVWVPMRLASLNVERGYNFIFVSGRMHQGVSRNEIQLRLNAFAARLAEAFPESHRNLSLQLMGLQEALVAGVRDNLWMLMVAVMLVMLIVCANVASLLLGRVLTRERELATRAAMGAKPARLAWQAMLEALLLAGAGAIVGLLIAAFALDVLVALQPPELPRLNAVRLDLRVLGFAVAAALSTGILCGLLPALRTLRTDFTNVLHGGGAGAVRERLWARRSLIVVGEVALSMALLVAAGLLFTTMKRVSNVDPGFDTGHLLTGMIALPAPLPASIDADAFLAQVRRNAPFLAELEQRLAALPGITGVGFIDSMPLSGTSNFSGTVSAPGVTFEPGREPTVENRWVSPGYFRAIGIPLLAGEGFEHGPVTSPPGGGIVINEALAELLWPGEPSNAINKQIEVGFLFGELMTVSGVVGNARQWSLDRKPSPELYLPYDGAPAPTTATIILRTSVKPLTLADALLREVAELDAQVPVFNVRTMEQAAAVGNARRAFALTLLAVFAGAAVFVAAIGLYGAMAYAVVRRTHDVGVRMALGAERGRVLRGFLRDGMTMALSGIAVGVGIAFLFARLLQGLVWGIDIAAPTIYLATGAGLAIVALGASLLPAWRASRIPPMEALRHE